MTITQRYFGAAHVLRAGMITLLVFGGCLAATAAKQVELQFAPGKGFNGAYLIFSASAPAMVLEAVDSGTSEGTIVSINHPTGAANQKWLITPQGTNAYVIHPAHSPALVMAVAKGGTERGTRIVLEADQQKDWQRWAIKPTDAETFCFVPLHESQKGMDHLGGKVIPGAKIDLWTLNPKDLHLQWVIKPVDGSPMPKLVDPTAEPEPIAPTEVPQVKLPTNAPPGKLTRLMFTNSAIFPGTVREVCVFVPAQYDGSKPACVYVRHDGYRENEQQVLEGLIAGGYMPVTIGVFVKPGELPAPDKETRPRRNRCYEYDGVSDNNVRFYLEEILPFVAKELKLKLSDSGNDRCIAGGSSGGISAFNCAWQRPDAFSRVYCVSGSFVAFRGGNMFPTLIRKTEAKPIRAYLTTGTHDMENCAGNWFVIDQDMDRALKLSDYDYLFRILKGPHGAGYFNCLPEAMAYLWKDWPMPVQAGPSAPRVQDVLVPGEDWKLAAKGLGEMRGATVNAAGEVYFIDVAKNKLMRLGTDGNLKEFAGDAQQANAATVGPKGEVYTVSAKTRKILQYTPEGKASVVTEGLGGHSILATPKGGLYVTCPGAHTEDGSTLWLVQGGKKTQVDSGLKKATGLAYRPDQWLLSVADGASKWVYSYQIGNDGRLFNKERFFWLHVADWDDDAGAESVCYGKEGQMFVATRIGIQVNADDGPTQVILPLPERVRPWSVCLGGAEGDMLFAFCGDRIYQRKVKAHAMGAFSPLMKPAGSHL